MRFPAGMTNVGLFFLVVPMLNTRLQNSTFYLNTGFCQSITFSISSSTFDLSMTTPGV